MVTRSIDNYDKHKQDIYNMLYKRNPKLAKEFIKYYSDKYDKFNRSFIDYRLALALYDDYIGVSKKHNMAWYAIVGQGGSGKTTNSKNMSYFLDKSFDIDRVKTELKDIIKMFKRYGMNDAKSYVLDEPDLNVSSNSKAGLVTRNVFGKARQQKAFMFFLATDLSDIPNFIYKKINRIIYCIKKGKAILLKDIPHKKIFFLGKLKKDYMDKLSYEVFFYPKYLKYALRFDTTGATTLSKEQEQKYDKNKRKDYDETLDIAEKLLAQNKRFDIKLSERDKAALSMRKKGMTTSEIGEHLGLSRSRISQIISNFNKNNDESGD